MSELTLTKAKVIMVNTLLHFKRSFRMNRHRQYFLESVKFKEIGKELISNSLSRKLEVHITATALVKSSLMTLKVIKLLLLALDTSKLKRQHVS